MCALNARKSVMSDAVICEKKRHVLYIMLNRPKCLNAINEEMALGLIDAWKKFHSDDGVRVALLYGAGDRAFCAGADTKSVIGASLPPDRSTMSDCMPGALFEINKPIICAVRGYCIGAGFVFTMHADMRIASTDAKFMYPEPKMGITAGKASVLAKHLPMAIAAEMLTLGGTIDGKRAYELGYVNRLVEPEDLMKEATTFAEEVAENSPMVVQLMKKMLRLSTFQTPIEMGTVISRILTEYRSSEDATEALNAINEKRKPQYKGR